MCHVRGCLLDTMEFDLCRPNLVPQIEHWLVERRVELQH